MLYGILPDILKFGLELWVYDPADWNIKQLSAVNLTLSQSIPLYLTLNGKDIYESVRSWLL